MRTISYVSDSVIPSEILRGEVATLVASAQKRNQDLAVTGVLFFENDHFFQTIEGPEETVGRLYEQIERDHRHRNVSKLLDEPIGMRAFEGWSLDTFYVDNPDLINPVTLTALRSLHQYNFGFEANSLIHFIKKMIDEMDTFKIEFDQGLKS